MQDDTVTLRIPVGQAAKHKVRAVAATRAARKTYRAALDAGADESEAVRAGTSMYHYVYRITLKETAAESRAAFANANLHSGLTAHKDYVRSVLLHRDTAPPTNT